MLRIKKGTTCIQIAKARGEIRYLSQARNIANEDDRVLTQDKEILNDQESISLNY